MPAGLADVNLLHNVSDVRESYSNPDVRSTGRLCTVVKRRRKQITTGTLIGGDFRRVGERLKGVAPPTEQQLYPRRPR